MFKQYFFQCLFTYLPLFFSQKKWFVHMHAYSGTSLIRELMTFILRQKMSGVLFLCRVGNGSWVSEGLQLVSNTTGANSTISVACNATHLTSFAVLVDVAGGHEVYTEELCRDMYPNLHRIFCTS